MSKRKTLLEELELERAIATCDRFNRMFEDIAIRPIPKVPEKYIINKGATIIFWNEDESDKTVVKLSDGDKYDKRLGFLIAYFQRYSGLSKTQANKFLDNLEEQDKK